MNILFYTPTAVGDERVNTLNPGLEIVKRICKEEGHQVDQVSYLGARKGFGGIPQPIGTYDIIAVNLIAPIQALNILPLLSRTRRWQRKIIGGFSCHHPTAYQELFDHVFQGDSEIVIKEYLNNHYNAGDKFIKGEIKELTTPSIIHKDTTAIEINRGCTHNCKFCYLRHNRKYIEKDLSLIKKEIRESTTKKIKFITADFFSHRHAKEIMRETLNQEKQVVTCNYRIDDIIKHRDLIKEANLQSISTGVESYTDNALTQSAKGFTRKEIRNAVKTMITSTGRTHYYLIYGLPLDIKSDLHEFVDYCRKIRKASLKPNITNISITPFQPQRGTPYENEPMPDLNKYQAFIRKLRGEGNVIWGGMSYERYHTGQLIHTTRKPLTKELEAVWARRYSLQQQKFQKKIWPIISTPPTKPSREKSSLGQGG